jgi:hypothetical protein
MCTYEVERAYGCFTIRMQHTHSKSNVDPLNLMDMSISVEDAYLKQNRSRQLMLELLTSLDPQLADATIYIDADASAGFWDHVGLVANPNYDTPDVPERGYEKCIAFRDLLAFSRKKSSPTE